MEKFEIGSEKFIMKLKKIASLALAGIMAVSMLTACGEGTGNNTNPPASSTPTTSAGLVSDVEDAIKDLNSTLTISVDENSALEDYIAKWNKYSTVTSVNNDIAKKVVNTIFGTGSGSTAYNFYNKSIIGDLSENVNSKTRTDGQKFVYYNLYTFGAVTADACRTQAVNDIAKCMENVRNDFTATAGAMRNDYTMYVYEGSVTDNSNKVNPYVLVVLISETSAV